MCQNAPPNTSSASHSASGFQCRPTKGRNPGYCASIQSPLMQFLSVEWAEGTLPVGHGCSPSWSQKEGAIDKESASYLTCKLLAPRKLFTLRRWRNLYGVSEHTHPLPSLDWNESWVWLKNQSAIKSHSHWWSSRNSCILHNTGQMHLTQLNTTHKTCVTQHNSCNLSKRTHDPWQ